jgi:crotonobetainyl-CoA:carnitine CoA-transferase CaiB-like acyl-CoA transferase
VRNAVTAWTSVRSRSEIVAALGGEVPVAPVNTVEDIFGDPHAKAREMLVEVEHPGPDRTVVIAGSPIKLTETPAGVHRRAPLLGEHTDEVLGDAGIKDEEIAAMRGAEVVR